MFLSSARQQGGSGNTLGGTKIYFSISGGLVPYYGCAWANLIIVRVIIIWGCRVVSFGN